MKDIIESIIKLHNLNEILIQDLKASDALKDTEVHNFCFEYIQINTLEIDRLRKLLKNKVDTQGVLNV